MNAMEFEFWQNVPHQTSSPQGTEYLEIKRPVRGLGEGTTHVLLMYYPLAFFVLAELQDQTRWRGTQRDHHATPCLV